MNQFSFFFFELFFHFYPLFLFHSYTHILMIFPETQNQGHIVVAHQHHASSCDTNSISFPHTPFSERITQRSLLQFQETLHFLAQTLIAFPKLRSLMYFSLFLRLFYRLQLAPLNFKKFPALYMIIALMLNYSHLRSILKLLLTDSSAHSLVDDQDIFISASLLFPLLTQFRSTLILSKDQCFTNHLTLHIS